MNNDMAKNNQEFQVERLLENFKRERAEHDFKNQPLCKVPFEVIWNEFSRSNWKLSVIA